MKRARAKNLAAKAEKAAASKAEAADTPAAPDAATTASTPPKPPSISTLVIGAVGFLCAALSSLVGIEEHSTQSHVVAFSISLVVALALGLSPGAKDFLERWTMKDTTRKVDYKKAATGWLLVLVPIGMAMGWTGASGAITVAGLAFSVAAFSD